MLHLPGDHPLDSGDAAAAFARRLRAGDAGIRLYRIVMTRLRWHDQTKAYVRRRLNEGKSKAEVIRC